MSLLEKTIKEAAQDHEIRLRMSYSEWLDQIDENTQSEWVDGEAIIFMPPATKHQQLVTYLVTLMRLYVDYFQLGEVIVAPFEMRVLPEGNAREPDILFVASDNVSRLTEQRLAGAADLLVEVISPESVQRDYEEKRIEYEAVGVREYWIVDPRPDHVGAQFWVLDDGGDYRAAPVDADGVYRSNVLTGFWLNVDWLWAEDAPSPLAAFGEIAGLPADILQYLSSGRPAAT